MAHTTKHAVDMLGRRLLSRCGPRIVGGSLLVGTHQSSTFWGWPSSVHQRRCSLVLSVVTWVVVNTGKQGNDGRLQNRGGPGTRLPDCIGTWRNWRNWKTGFFLSWHKIISCEAGTWEICWLIFNWRGNHKNTEKYWWFYCSLWNNLGLSLLMTK